ncbi:MAG TPA: gliding motility lipoprotein GldJ [Bacteroidales bacterium]|nr:MAG: gliding motility lipoprotein GldJ [Bacteroidetes bacterium GWE2_42_24]OFY26079.1 MAG: gliding motility lipoprotein GldJ [Bacteroidetes bacterium GWF2_43_11]HAQ65276.1 gliding motility lipoprotein GldJ [Bacteroidales bacterium]HBZ65391.1 gliding motility lipoprotein GldJ [Bacteroidales bacterium]
MTRLSKPFLYFTLLTFLFGVITSCSVFKKGKEQSAATGWNYNDPEQGGFEKFEFTGQDNGPGLILVEGGSFLMGSTQDYLIMEQDNEPRRVTVRSFYMDQTEVSNLHYLEFLHWMKKVFYTQATMDYQQYYLSQLPDTLVWRAQLAYNEPLVNLYLRHPAYRDYPVVGVSWLQANEFCRWRTDRVNEIRLYGKGIYALDVQPDANDFFTTDAYLTNQFIKGDQQQGTNERLGLPDIGANVGQGNAGTGGGQQTLRHARIEDGIILPAYRLPTEAEWEFAALGLIGNSEFENIRERRIYPWDGNFTRSSNESDGEIGRFMANFKRGRGDYMGIAGSLNDGADVPAPVISYYPNDYGLYNMAGNVAEWVADVYRRESPFDVSDMNPFRGNLFTAPVPTSSGSQQIDNSRQPDTTYNSPKTVYDISTQTYKEEKSYNPDYRRIKRTAVNPSVDPTLPFRRNYRTADNRNYLDGDWASHVDFQGNDWKKQGDNKEATQFMYNNGDWTGGIAGDGASTLITDRTRVYKGGSWKDGAYFMSPGQRRFLEENLSSDFIGFRCAMDRVGTSFDGQGY